MDTKKFLRLCEKAVEKYTFAHLDAYETPQFNVFVVWCCKTLQNNKALLSTTLNDGMYYEITYNGDKKKMYVDAYKKRENFVVKVD